MFRIAAVLATILSATMGLVCLETLDNGFAVEKDCPNCNYCHISGPTLLKTKPTVFGLYKEVEADEQRIYDQIFGLSGSAGTVGYSVLTTCIFERYVSPRMKKPEYLFRCVCNKNKCNNGSNFEQFLNNLKHD